MWKSRAATARALSGSLDLPLAASLSKELSCNQVAYHTYRRMVKWWITEFCHLYPPKISNLPKERQFPSASGEAEGQARASSETRVTTEPFQTAASATSQAATCYTLPYSMHELAWDGLVLFWLTGESAMLPTPGFVPTDSCSLTNTRIFHKSGAVTGTWMQLHRLDLHTCGSCALFVQNITHPLRYHFMM